jgi:hypothetical protein
MYFTVILSPHILVETSAFLAGVVVVELLSGVVVAELLSGASTSELLAGAVAVAVLTGAVSVESIGKDPTSIQPNDDLSNLAVPNLAGKS